MSSLLSKRCTCSTTESRISVPTCFADSEVSPECKSLKESKVTVSEAIEMTLTWPLPDYRYLLYNQIGSGQGIVNANVFSKHLSNTAIEV